MHLDDKSIRPHYRGAHRARLDKLRVAGGMAGVHDDGQVRKPLQDRNHRKVDRVPRRGLERTNATFAEHDVRVPARHYVFGAHQQLLERCAHPPLEQDGLLRHRPDLLEKIEILHVPCADLDHVDIVEQRQMLNAHEFRDYGQPGLPLRLEKYVEAALAQALERVGRRARLERAAAQQRRSGGLHTLGNARHLLYGLHAAGSSYHLKIAAADLGSGAIDHGIVRMELPVGRLVWLLDSLDALHDAERLHEPYVHLGNVAYAPNERLALSRAYVRRDVAILQPLDKAVDLLWVCAFLQYDNHSYLLPLKSAPHCDQTKTASLSSWSGAACLISCLLVFQDCAKPLRTVSPK